MQAQAFEFKCSTYVQCTCMVGVKKFPFTVRTTERAIPFCSRLISVPLLFIPRPFSTRSRFSLRAARPFN